MADMIIEVIQELGIEKCIAVVTDNAANMQASWNIIESRYPHISCNGCGAHAINIFIKDVCKINVFEDTLEKVSFISKFVKNRQFVRAKYDEL
jgi:hypothetical protein